MRWLEVALPPLRDRAGDVAEITKGLVPRICERNGYAVHHAPIGEADEKLGPPTQMAVFSR